MKILYGIQATGNGHLTRGRAMAPLLRAAGADLTCVISGRAREDLWDMEPFGDYHWYRGLTFATKAGRVQMFKTISQSGLGQFYRDLKTLDISDYDLVLTDFEPVSAWAARRAGKPCLGVGHQYAFHHPIPKRGSNPAVNWIMRQFAPVDRGLGLHWHHFNQPILPPIVDLPPELPPVKDNKIIVYLGFEELTRVLDLLRPFTDFDFMVYSPQASEPTEQGHLHIRPLSRLGFQRDLADASGVITNAGFELASESIQMGKKVLVKPLSGQMEQMSNALALEMLNLGQVMKKLDSGVIADWLQQAQPSAVRYPNVAAAIAQWVMQGNWNDHSALVRDLWAQVESPERPDFAKFTAGALAQAA